jgi:hypothetical protein
MTFLSGMQSVANKLLTKYGESVTFTRTSSTLNPVTGATTSTTSTFSGYANPMPFETGEVDGSLIQYGDIRLLVESVSSAPNPDDVVTFRSEDYRVMMSTPISTQGGDAAYKVHARK